MPKKTNFLTYLTLLAAVVLIVVMAVVAFKNPKINPAAPNNNQAQSTGGDGKIKPVAPAQVPSGLPSNLPWEKDATVLQNFEFTDPTSGKTQSTRVYVSKKSLDENFAMYKTYLSNNDWTLAATIDQPNLKNISAAKSGARLDVTITKDPKGQVTVNVSYLN